VSLTKHSPALGRVAGGNHCTADNDEPEPHQFGDLTERDLEEIDAQYHIKKTTGQLRQRDDRIALDLQVKHQREV
jgi:hypothetical protein